MSDSESMVIDAALVRRLVAEQFPQWAGLAVTPVACSGWDNRTFHLGAQMSVRLPSAEHYAPAVVKEQRWLPWLAPQLPLPIPQPLAQGVASADYPWPWSIYGWLEGGIASRDSIVDLTQFAVDLANFLRVLQSLDPTDGPVRKLRGGSLQRYDGQFHEALTRLDTSIDAGRALAIWLAALAEPLVRTPVWYHGDVAAGNLLTRAGRLSAVIDFGGLGVGDPACDMSIAWTLLEPISRAAFRDELRVSTGVWNRGRGWALWKAMIVVSGLVQTNVIEANSADYALAQLLGDDS